MNKLEIVVEDSGDWQRYYVNEELFAEGNCLDADDILQALYNFEIIDYDVVDVDEEDE